jgi:Uma2 family endonuclease
MSEGEKEGGGERFVCPLTDEASLLRRMHEISLEKPEPQRMNYNEFLASVDEDTLAEWVDGEVVMYTPASRQHQMLLSFLERVLGIFVELNNLGIVIIAPFQMRLAQSGREPDLLFVDRANVDRLKETHLDGPADLVVEVTSPESMGRDRGEKFYEYENAGITEYWLIDPLRREAEFYQLGAQRHYRMVMPDADRVFRSSVVPGFWLRVDWLWQEPPPSPIRAMSEIVGMDPSLMEAFERALSGR